MTTAKPHSYLWILGLALSFAACGGEEAPSPDGAASLPPGNPSDPEGAEALEDDVQPPEFPGLSLARCVGWGKIELGWTAATDNASQAHEIRYRIEGFAPDPSGLSLPGTRPGVEPSVRFITGPGVVGTTVTASGGQSIWQVLAIDAAGNESAPTLPRQVHFQPRLRLVPSGAVEGDLVSCTHTTGGQHVCGGRNGRYIGWDGVDWYENAIPIPAEVRAVSFSAGDQVQLATDIDIYSLASDLTAQRLERTFDGFPSVPWRRVTWEPTGLAILLDRTGEVWASERDHFRRLDNPLLSPQSSRCASIAEIFFSAERGFAWCQDGRQFLLRSGASRYQWTELPESSGLPFDPSPQRRILFGEGRQITMLTTGGDVYRYDLGGWQPLYQSRIDDLPATAIAAGSLPGSVLVAAVNRLILIDTSGAREIVAELDTRSPVIHVDTPDDNAVAITADAQVISLPGGQHLRSMPPSGFTLAARSGSEVVGALASSPEFGLYRRQDQVWTWSPERPLPSGFVPHALRVTSTGSRIFVGDGGERGGQILIMNTRGSTPQEFLYPRPASPSEDSAGPPGNPSAVPQNPASQTLPFTPPIGVPADELPTPMGPPPPVRAMDLDEATQTQVAVGEGGSIWLRIQNGWLRIESMVMTPLLAVAITGDHRYLAGGTGSAIVSCEWDRCRAQYLDIGDILSFSFGQDEVWALGRDGVAALKEDQSWERLSLSFEEPYPRGRIPTGFLRSEVTRGHRWLLSDDGTLWLEVGGWYRAMALLDDPLDLGVLPQGEALVVTPDALLVVEPLEERR